MRSQLCFEPGVITWLHPHGDGACTPECLTDTAFRPLAEWVDYVLEHERRPLEEWVQSTLFDFEAFVCTDDARSKPKKPSAPERQRPKATEVQASPKAGSRIRPDPEM